MHAYHRSNARPSVLMHVIQTDGVMVFYETCSNLILTMNVRPHSAALIHVLKLKLTSKKNDGRRAVERWYRRAFKASGRALRMLIDVH